MGWAQVGRFDTGKNAAENEHRRDEQEDRQIGHADSTHGQPPQKGDRKDQEPVPSKIPMVMLSTRNRRSSIDTL